MPKYFQRLLFTLAGATEAGPSSRPGTSLRMARSAGTERPSAEEPWSAWVLRLDTCVGNVDGADCVDFEDLIYLLNHWGPECSPSRVQSR